MCFSAVIRENKSSCISLNLFQSIDFGVVHGFQTSLAYSTCGLTSV